MYLAALIGVILAGTLPLESLVSTAAPAGRDQSLQGGVQRSRSFAHRPAPAGNTHVCVPLGPGKPQKGVLSSHGSACFTVEVGPGEAAQLLLDQPQDLEIHLIGDSAERLVDSFDMGIETVTITASGAYRVEIRKVGPSPGSLTFSIVRWKVGPEKASAWQQAEIWATASKRTRRIEDIDKSLALWQDLGDTGPIARTSLKRGSVLNANDPAAARMAYEKALELCRANFDTRCSAEAENNSGSMSRRLGDIDQAGLRLKEAAQDWRRLADLPNEARTLSNLGLMLWQSGDFEQAIGSLDRAGRILRGMDTVGYAKALNNLGLCYLSLAEYEKARAYFAKAVQGFARGRDIPNLVQAQMNLGRSYMLQGNVRQAQPVLERAVTEAGKLTGLHIRADALRNLAQNLWRAGKDDQARSRLELALEVDRFDGDRRGQSSALHYLGLIAEKSGDISTARSLLTEAVRLRREIGLRDDAAESLFAIAGLEYRAGHLDAARDFAEQALKLLESVRGQVASAAMRASYYSRKRQFFDLLVDLAMTPDDPNAVANGLLAVERGRGRSLIDLLSGGLLLQQLPPDLAGQRASVRRRLDYLLHTPAENLSPDKETDLHRRTELLLAEDEAIEARIRQLIADQKLAQPLQSVEEVQREYLPAGSALLEYHLGAQKSHLWLVDAQRIQVLTLPPAGIIEAQAALVVQEFGHILERRRSPEKRAAFDRALRKLSVTLLGPLSDVHLPPRLVLVPDGVLHRVPFAALWLPKAFTQLGLAHDVLQVPSAAYLMAGKRPRPISQFPQTILAVADPVFSPGDPRVTSDHRKPLRTGPGFDLGRLAFTGEIATIESLVPRSRRRVLRGFDASRAKLGELQLETFGILHFSTHAVIDDRLPERSRVILSMVDRAGRPVDGFLHPYQLAQLHLEGSIVVLSACDTALGKQVLGEGIVGLSSGLLYAGGSQLVLTLTEVDAEASSRFVSDVYKRFLPGANNMEHSLTLARQAMARSRRFSDPYYWASFVVIGRPADAVNSGLASTYNRR